jgi:hypothetical protein
VTVRHNLGITVHRCRHELDMHEPQKPISHDVLLICEGHTWILCVPVRMTCQ